MSQSNPNRTDDTGGANQNFEDSAATMEKEAIHQMTGRQKQFIEQLEAPLVNIGNKSYGGCCSTGN